MAKAEATVVASLRRDGLTTPVLWPEALYGASFLAYVEQVLVPMLRRATWSSWTI